MPIITLNLSKEINARLDEIARQDGIDKSDCIRKAFALLSIAHREKQKGNRLALVQESAGQEPEIITMVVGV